MSSFLKWLIRDLCVLCVEIPDIYRIPPYGEGAGLGQKRCMMAVGFFFKIRFFSSCAFHFPFLKNILLFFGSILKTD